MILSCCAWALSTGEDETLRTLQDEGLRWVDVRPFAYAGRRDRLRQAGISVSCVGASVALSEDVTLDSADAAIAAAAIDHVTGGLDYAADLQANTAYLVPHGDASPTALARFARAPETLAEGAAEVVVVPRWRCDRAQVRILRFLRSVFVHDAGGHDCRNARSPPRMVQCV